MAVKTMTPPTRERKLDGSSSSWTETQYHRSLVPLDGSEEAEWALVSAHDLLPPGGRGVLLRVIAPEKSGRGGDAASPRARRQEARRSGALGYLHCAVGDLTSAPGRWRCEVVVAESVPEAIAETASREEVDLITMYSHGRKGLARLIKGSITEKVQQLATTELRVLRPPSWAEATRRKGAPRSWS
jgi:nucleotide-binding universal stress UspA family protein